MRYAGISVQKYDVKTNKKSRKHGVRARPLPRPVAGTGHGSRSPPGSSRPGKPRHGKACPVAPASTRAPVTAFVRSPAGNPGTVVCHVAALRLPSRACRKGARHTNRPPFRGHAAEPRLPSLYNIHQCSSFALLPVESRAAPPLQACPASRSRAASGLSGTGHAVYRSAFSRVPCSVKIFASCRDRSGPFLALTWTRGTYMIVY